MASLETKPLIRKLGLKLVSHASEGLFELEDAELGEDVLVAGFPHGDFYSDDIKDTTGIMIGKKDMGNGQSYIDGSSGVRNAGEARRQLVFQLAHFILLFPHSSTCSAGRLRDEGNPKP